MEETDNAHLLTRRSLLQTTATLGLGTLSATVANLASPFAMFAGSFGLDFVGTSGTNFTMHNKPFYFAGTNNYYLHYTSQFMIDDVLKGVVAMGLPVLRLWGFLDGKPSNGFVMQPTPGSYPEAGYERFDYTVWKAGQLGLKLVVPLVNNWNDFGGMLQYVTWFGGTNHDDFYTNSAVKTAYKNYVHNFLQRKNRYTGRAMLEDATVMTWELANEPRCQSDATGNILLEWAHEMSAYIKSLDSKHLVAVGDEGFYNFPGNSDWTRSGGSGVDWKRLIALPTIDYGTYHLYPNGWMKDNPWAVQWIKDHIHDGKSAGKPTVLEEFGWADLAARDAIYRTWTDTVRLEGGNGDQFWILTGLQDDGTLYPNYDGFRVTYPSSTASVLSAHAAQMRMKCV